MSMSPRWMALAKSGSSDSSMQFACVVAEHDSHLHDSMGVVECVGETLGDRLLGLLAGGGITQHVNRLVGFLGVLCRLFADEHLNGAPDPAQAHPATVSPPG